MPQEARTGDPAVILNGMNAVTSDARDRVRNIRTVMEWIRSQEKQLAAERDEAILLMVADGMTYDSVAREAGVTRGRVGQIVQQARGATALRLLDDRRVGR